MKTLFLMFVVSVSFFLSSSAFAAAVLLDARGDVSVILPERKVEPAKVGMELPNGSIVAVTSGTATLLLESGAVDELPSRTTYTVGVESGKGQRTDLGSGIALAMRELSSSGEGPTVHGMVKEAAGPRNIELRATGAQTGLQAVHPVGTAVRLGDVIVFSWTKPVDFSNPALVIDDARGKRIATEVLPAGAAKFEAQTRKLGLGKGEAYTWFLAQKSGKGVKGKTARFKFTTLSADEERALASERARIQAMKLGDAGAKLLDAQALFQHGLYGEMVEELMPIRETPFARKLLRLGYLKMGNAAEAEKYR